MRGSFRKIALAWLALSLVAGFVGGQLLNFVHHRGVGHQICAEHGEWVHVSQSAESPVPDPAAWQSARPIATHEHCSLHARSEAQDRALKTDWDGHTRAADSARLGPEGDSIHGGIGRLHLAPKLSPPSA